MNDDESNDDLKDLYEDFAGRLSDGNMEMFYDLDELLDIFDYANEVYDSYVCNAVLRLGARLYPESDELRVRQGVALIQHIDTDFPEFERFMRDNESRRSTMWSILRLYLHAQDRPQAKVDLLEQIVATSHFGEDEEVVQFVNAVEYLDCCDWLLANVNKVRKICDYSPTLLFDVAGIARRSSRHDLAIKLLDELTMMEPFSIDFWIELAKAYDDAGRLEDGTTAIDYARTLQPDNIQAKVYAYERSSDNDLESEEQLIKRLEELRDALPENPVIKHTLAQKYAEMSRSADAARLSREVFDENPGDSVALEAVIGHDPDNTAHYLSRFSEALNESAGENNDWDMGILCACRALEKFCFTDPDTAGKVYRAFLGAEIVEQPTNSYYLYMYLSGNDVAALDMFESLAATGRYSLPVQSYPLIAVMYMRRSRMVEALACCEHFKNLLGTLTPHSLDMAYAFEGVATQLDKIAAYAGKHKRCGQPERDFLNLERVMRSGSMKGRG